MKKHLIITCFLLFGILLISGCQKDDNGKSSVDGTTWQEIETRWPHTLKLKEGYASLYYEDKLYDVQAYSLKGNVIKFKNHLIIEPEESDPAYYYQGTFNEDKTRLTLQWAVDGNDSHSDTYIRVIE